MFKGNRKVLGLFALIACALGSQAFAQTRDASSSSRPRRSRRKSSTPRARSPSSWCRPARSFRASEVVWTVTANNICKQPSDKVTINNAVPEHMTLVPNSAIRPGQRHQLFARRSRLRPAGQLTVQENGAARPARADEYKHIRWEFKDSLQPGASAFARFRAVLN